MRIVIAPYSARLHTNKPNPKNPPEGFWPLVVGKLKGLGHEVIQIGGLGEERIEGVSECFINWPLKALRELLRGADTFICVDTWLQHFVWAEKLDKCGVVIFSQSSPRIWGHPENINLLKSEKYLREFQYQSWPEATYNADAFVSPDEVIDAVTNLLASTRSTDRAGLVPTSMDMARQAQEESFTF